MNRLDRPAAAAAAAASAAASEPGGGRWLTAVLLVGLLVRILGIGWGLPSGLIPGEPPFHPDELAPWDEGGTLYTAPDPITFTWGGAFYFRLAWLVRAIGEGMHPANAIAATVFTITWLRLINVAVGVASGYAIYRAGALVLGRRAGLLAAFLFLTFPAHVLECHYARPDVVQLGFTCAVAWCAAALATRRVASAVRTSILGGVLAGLAIATMLWGVLALVALAAAVMVAEWGGRLDARYVRRVAGIGVAIAVAAFVGYLLGSVRDLRVLGHVPEWPKARRDDARREQLPRAARAALRHRPLRLRQRRGARGLRRRGGDRGAEPQPRGGLDRGGAARRRCRAARHARGQHDALRAVPGALARAPRRVRDRGGDRARGATRRWCGGRRPRRGLRVRRPRCAAGAARLRPRHAPRRGRATGPGGGSHARRWAVPRSASPPASTGTGPTSRGSPRDRRAARSPSTSFGFAPTSMPPVTSGAASISSP
ncbi:MAG: glycosyltransferase family 39 protein [Deltaproteobacteria bacterium]|nr:glycosyltransferase family 39 protein [Deltaproteobacteria bacterium]